MGYSQLDVIKVIFISPAIHSTPLLQGPPAPYVCGSNYEISFPSREPANYPRTRSTAELLLSRNGDKAPTTCIAEPPFRLGIRSTDSAASLACRLLASSTRLLEETWQTSRFQLSNRATFRSDFVQLSGHSLRKPPFLRAGQNSPGVNFPRSNCYV